VGDKAVMKPLVHNSKGLEIVHTPVYVEMNESPSNALRKKKDSSINKAFELHKNGDVQALFRPVIPARPWLLRPLPSEGLPASTDPLSPYSTLLLVTGYRFSSMPRYRGL